MGRIAADSRSVAQLLAHRYEIDYYQREYRWEERQVAELIEDLVGKFQDAYQPGDERQRVAGYDGYFLGSVVIAERGGTRFIVDGQQRLTTLTLLLLYLYRLQQDRMDVPPLIFSEQYGQQRFNISVEERDDVMRALYASTSYDPSAEPDSSARNIWDRFANVQSQFAIEEKKLDGTEPVEHFTDWLLERVTLVEILATDEEDAYTIFESMNDRGLSLSPAEMLKGYLLSRAEDGEQQERINDIWRARMLDLIGRSKDDELDFFKAWLRARYAETIRENRRGAVNRDFDHIGTGFHKWVRDNAPRIGLSTPSDYVTFVLDDFARYSSHYLRARDWADRLQPPYEAVFFTARNGFTLQYPLLLSPVTSDDSTETANAKMRLVATYLDIYVARRVINSRSLRYQTIVRPMFGLMRELRQQSEIEAIRTFLMERLEALPEQIDADALAGFRRHQLNQGFVFHLLARLTFFVERCSATPTNFDRYLDRSPQNRYDIEHVWPNTPDEYLAQYPDRFGTRDEATEFRDRLGGLVLLPEKVNRSLGARPFREKRDAYLQDNLLAGSLHPAAYENNPGFTRWIAEADLPFKSYDEFDATALEERHELYLELCRLVWSPSRLASEQ